ncbi:AAA family ATPase [Xylanimonas ulmi]|uniref:Regulatory LuxR family protein n=1 Tax=Xylanimonas ulmi TaxID=228973 RepID=A0A4Q7LYL6_9MICO|nr:LuxR family transcriptional regulator [Xylanibacterium ulmi]RZS60355.1 regulatory LuxR family protein [Xylanibacterium ulmi]
MGGFLGRHAEQERVRALAGRARNGRGGALLIVGEPGIGKTALLDVTTTGLAGLRVLRVDGYEAESTIPFAGVQRLGLPLVEYLDDLPRRHRRALAVAAGVAEGTPSDRFLVGLGVLGLLARAGESTPLLCVVDDAHLLDPESLDVLAFVGRRLQAESVSLVLAGRSAQGIEARAAGIETLRLGGLDQEWAVRLLKGSVPDIDPSAAVRIVAAAGGNPLALIDLATELTGRQLAESTFSDEPLPVGHHLEAHYVRQVRQLPPDAQLWLLVAAADSTGNLALVLAAGQALGLSAERPVDAAEAAGLVQAGPQIRFRHPLVKSAVYGAAHGAARRQVHRALSAAADRLGLVELEAWHAAKATLGVDAAVADRLERVADIAGRRGGFSSRAGVLAQSSALTPPGPLRFARLVSAAEAALAAGVAQLATTYLDDVDEGALDPVARGRLISTRASIAMFIGDPALVGAGADMLAAAEAFHGHDAALEQHALIRAFECTLSSERLARGVTLAEIGARLRQGSQVGQGLASTILRGLSAHILLPYAKAVPEMRAALEAIRGLGTEDLLRYGATSVALSTALWDAQARKECLERTVEAARDTGSLQVLDTSLWILSLAELSGGTPRRSAQYVEQVRELRRAIGYDAENVINVALLAWIGAPRAQVEMIADGAAAMGFGGVHASGVAALGIRDLAEGLYADAYRRLKTLVDDPFLQVTPLELPSFVEAATRSGHAEEAVAHVERLEELADANGSAWARGVAQRSRALIADEPQEHFVAAVRTLAQGVGYPIELARAHLLYGEWLRRVRRRREAREHLYAALEIFERELAPVFAQRARNELAALGEQSPQVGGRGDLGLTPQQMTVAEMAAAGQTNAEIAAALFLSANTVDYHLRKVFQRLGISSRRQLAERLVAG